MRDEDKTQGEAELPGELAKATWFWHPSPLCTPSLSGRPLFISSTLLVDESPCLLDQYAVIRSSEMATPVPAVRAVVSAQVGHPFTTHVLSSSSWRRTFQGSSLSKLV